jgi:hypothetical protein
MKRPQRGSTPKQYAYATRKLGGQGSSKKEMALLSGFSPSVAANAKRKIESTEGYHNAVAVLAHESNNLLLEVFAQFKARGLDEFSNKDLVSALNAIASAWDRIDTKRAPDRMKTPEGNPLRRVFERRVETQRVTEEEVKEEPTHVEATVINPDAIIPNDLDF